MMTRQSRHVITVVIVVIHDNDDNHDNHDIKRNIFAKTFLLTLCSALSRTAKGSRY